MTYGTRIAVTPLEPDGVHSQRNRFHKDGIHCWREMADTANGFSVNSARGSKHVDDTSVREQRAMYNHATNWESFDDFEHSKVDIG